MDALLRRRMMMDNVETEKEEMVEWKTLLEEELTEDKAITLNDLDCTEVEAYIISNGWDEAAEIYLTSESSGTIYGTPRAFISAKTTPFIIKLGLKMITPYLWETNAICIPYFAGTNYSTETKSYTHQSLGSDINKEMITGLSLVDKNANLKAETKVFIRGR